MLPFTHAQFLEIFTIYNEAVWPSQIAAYVVAVVMVGSLAIGNPKVSGRIVSAGLGFMWLWTGIAYHWLQFTTINKAAWAFGALFVLQGLLFLSGSVRGMLRIEKIMPQSSRWVGWGLIAYATVFYPVLGAILGLGYPAMPMFGITPCPVTRFTFGFLVLASGPIAWWLMVVSVIWSLVGGRAAFVLRVPQDWPLFLSGASVFLIARNGRTATLRLQSHD